jgi:hypothetical protein
MFYVYHTGEIGKSDVADERVTAIDRGALADMVINAGLFDWVTNKVS